MRVKMPAWQACEELTAVWLITAYKNGAVYKTKFLGHALKTRPMLKDEFYGPLSTDIMRQKVVELDLID